MRTNRKPNLNNAYTDKQIDALKAYVDSDFKIMILSGAVRTGKTVIDNDLFLMELRRVSIQAKADGVREPLYILAGYSSTTITDNVLNPISNKYNIDFGFDKHGAFKLWGVKVVMAYTGNTRGMSAIRGMTAYGAYINEASLATKSVFEEINNRVSVKGGRILCDTNPDSPTHWLKTGFIDNKDPDLRVKTINFKLEDNRKFLEDSYISQLKASYGSGAMYDRAILGLWASGEGAVYVDWYDEENYIDRDDLPKIKKYYAGVDWGYKHYGSIVVVGEDYDGNIYLVDEYSRTLKGINFWKEVAQDIEEKYGKHGENGSKLIFVCDTARTENIEAFIMDNLMAVYANKRVEQGIELMAALIKTRKFKVVRDVLNNKDEHGNSISIFEDNIHGYVWDDDKGVVLKEHDDCLDALRYVVMYIYGMRGKVRVADIFR